MSLNNKGFGKYSKTDIKLEKTFGIASLVDCHLHTGRTHQIRLHLTSKNSPIIGDKIYGKSKINQFGKDKNTFNKFMILKILKDKHCMLIILVLIILHQKKDGF